MKNIWILISIISAIIVGISCQDSEVQVDAELSLSIKAQQADDSQGSSFLDIRCGGEWTLSLEFQEDVNPWATLSTTSGVGNKKNAYLSWETNMTSVSRFVKIVLTSGNETAECLFTQSAKDAEPVVKPDVDVDVTKVNWMELPAMDDPDLEYYAHSFKMGGKKYRNYSFGWSKKDFVAIWVAYPQCTFYLNGSASGGSGDWEPNPWFSDDFQPIYYNSFGYSQGYERGHQIANADRKCNAEANKQTFYFTNATLQHNSFNGYVWANLEANMRTTAKSADTLYVVTGCVLGTSPHYISDSRGHRVPVPSGYFKAALRYQKSLANQQQDWLGAAFYLDHDSSKYPSQQITASEAMSIDELEKKLGIDFFVNLPALIGESRAASVEMQNPVNQASKWGIK